MLNHMSGNVSPNRVRWRTARRAAMPNDRDIKSNVGCMSNACMLHIVGNAEILLQSSQSIGEHDELSYLDIRIER
jgi:hypothetical protein